MWKNKILIFDWTEIDKTGEVEDTDEATVDFIESKLDELGEDGWEPYALDDQTGDQPSTVVFLKRWVPAE